MAPTRRGKYSAKPSSEGERLLLVVLGLVVSRDEEAERFLRIESSS